MLSHWVVMVMNGNVPCYLRQCKCPDQDLWAPLYGIKQGCRPDVDGGYVKDRELAGMSLGGGVPSQDTRRHAKQCHRQQSTKTQVQCSQQPFAAVVQGVHNLLRLSYKLCVG